MCLIGVAFTVEHSEDIGSFVTACVLIKVGFNLSLILYGTVKEIRNIATKLYHKHKSKKAMQKKQELEERYSSDRKVIKNLGDDLPKFSTQRKDSSGSSDRSVKPMVRKAKT